MNRPFELYKKVRYFIRNAFKKRFGMDHFERTAYWIKKLEPDADEALMIAAIAHDIERAFRSSSGTQSKREKEIGYHHIDYLRHHQEAGAKIIESFLAQNGADKKLIDRVKMLVSRHEEGGTHDQNLLKDADSISFFENNISYFLEHKIHEAGKENVIKKFKWMYQRITSKNAKKIAKPYYEKAMKDIKKVNVE